MMGKSTAKTPEECIAQLEEPRKSQIKELYDFINKILPNEKPFMYAGIISWGKYHYKSKSNREGDWMMVGLASQKNYISVYVCAADGTQYVAEKYKDELGKTSVGKSCIRFKKIEDVNLPILKKTILEGMQWLEEGKVPFATAS
jgi:hypothetical protein